MSERIRALGLISKGATIDELRADSAVGAVCQSLLEDESFLVEAVQRYPYFVTQLDAPSEKVMLEAVKNTRHFSAASLSLTVRQKTLLLLRYPVMESSFRLSKTRRRKFALRQ